MEIGRPGARIAPNCCFASLRSLSPVIRGIPHLKFEMWGTRLFIHLMGVKGAVVRPLQLAALEASSLSRW
jgi:hypothetical protein